MGSSAVVRATSYCWTAGADLEERERVVATTDPAEKAAARAILYGPGGAGLFSDGKLNFSPRIGGAPLDVLDGPLHLELSRYVIDELGLDLAHPSVEVKERLEAQLFRGLDWELVPVPQAHIGSDYLPSVVRQLIAGFEDRILCGRRVVAIGQSDDGFYAETDDEVFRAENLVVAVGQAGSKFAERVARQFGLTVDPAPADIGIRVEMPSELWETMVELQWDPKIYWRVQSSEVRTFCTNPRGYVVVEYKRGFFSVNGHAKRDSGSDYTNFALMVRLPVDDPNEFGVRFSQRISNATGERLLVQRVADLLGGRPTTSIGSWRPTCGAYVLGDIRPFYPPAALEAYISVLSAIDESFPTFVQSGSIVYAPEVKLYSNRIVVNKNSFESEIPGLFFLGDSCGHIHGLTNALLSGLACARHCAFTPSMRA
jgi:uncharacterized FAD-dependent dehydrogenase